MFPVHQVGPKPSCKAQRMGEEDKADKVKIICGAPTTLTVKGLMMMMMMTVIFA